MFVCIFFLSLCLHLNLFSSNMDRKSKKLSRTNSEKGRHRNGVRDESIPHE